MRKNLKNLFKDDKQDEIKDKDLYIKVGCIGNINKDLRHCGGITLALRIRKRRSSFNCDYS